MWKSYRRNLELDFACVRASLERVTAYWVQAASMAF